ncbi:AMP-binding protein [Streptomyces liangshanensis]|uniref:AMP-binding protein n=1 Tax=Streptomyces liangshanensis TaxID=2717324 RepID=UPI0036D942B1
MATQLAQAGAVMNARFHAAVADLGRGRVPGFGPVAATPLTYASFHPASFADVYRAMAVGGSLVVGKQERDNPEKRLPVGLDVRLAETSGPVLLDGRPTPVTEVRVAGARGESLPDGEVGELWVRGQSLASGYWSDPAAGPGPGPAPGAFPEGGGGWFTTGLRAALREGCVVRWDGDPR